MANVLGMQDSYSNLLLEITNEQGAPILKFSQHLMEFDTLDLNRDLVRFMYEYIDDDVDQGFLAFETADVNLPDNPFIQEGQRINITWGYRSPKLNTKTKLVVITGFVARYLEDKIVIEVEFSSASVDIRKDGHRSLTEGQTDTSKKLSDFIDWVETIAGVKGKDVNIIYNSVPMFTKNSLDKLIPIRNAAVPNPVPAAVEFQDNNTTTQTSFQREEEKNRVELLPPETKNFGLTFKEITDKWVEELGELKLKTTNGSIYQNIEKSLKDLPDGPHYINLTDDEIRIHNRDKFLLGDPKRVYQYRGGKGDLLTYLPEIDTTDTDTDSMNVDGYDEEEDKPQTGVSQNVTLNSNDLSRVKIVDPKTGKVVPYDQVSEWLTEQEIIELQNEFYSKLFEDFMVKGITTDSRALSILIYKDGKKGGLNREIAQEVTKVSIKTNPVDGSEVYTPDVQNTTAINNTAVVLPNLPETSARIVFSAPDDWEFLKEKILNYQREKEQYKYTARGRVIGDPGLESEMVIAVYGVARKFSGKQYIMTCRHTIDRTGYLTDFESLLNTPEMNTLVGLFENLQKRKDDLGNTEEMENTSNYEERFRKNLGITYLDARARGREALLQFAEQQTETLINDFATLNISQDELQRLTDDLKATLRNITLETLEINFNTFTSANSTSNQPQVANARKASESLINAEIAQTIDPTLSNIDPTKGEININDTRLGRLLIQARGREEGERELIEFIDSLRKEVLDEKTPVTLFKEIKSNKFAVNNKGDILGKLK